MSNNITNFTTNMLSITDKNITFSGNTSTKVIHGLKTLVFDATLTYSPKLCIKCGSLDNKQIIKHGFKTMYARILPVNGSPSAIRLRKQRFLCKECNSTFVAETTFIRKCSSISNILKTHILSTLSMKVSEKDIAKINNVSHATVSRYIDKDFKKYSPNRFSLPKNISFDEFKSTGDSKGAMSFIITDLDKKKVVDIVENRQLRYLKRYFYRFTRKARLKVKTITIDMYQPYISLIKEMFPNAKIIFDRFHIINNLSRALLKTRIDIMKNIPITSMTYKGLKRYWKLIQRDYEKLDARDFRRFVHFKELKTECGIVSDLVNIHPILANTYNTYQILLRDIKSKDYDSLLNHLNSLKEQVSHYMKTAIQTMIDNFEYVKNALIYDYSNGFTEGINNFIKVLKRIAFGYKSFFHFRNRILITMNLKQTFS